MEEKRLGIEEEIKVKDDSMYQLELDDGSLVEIERDLEMQLEFEPTLNEENVWSLLKCEAITRKKSVNLMEKVCHITVSPFLT